MKKLKDTAIIPECYVDTNLTETLTGIICNHQKGCPNVVKQMKEKRTDRFALGIIDKDKRQVGYIDEFSKIVGNEHLEVLKHKSRPHYIVYIIPAIEAFILSAATEQRINLTDYGLPTELETLKRHTKQQDSKNDPRFSNLFKAIKETTSFKLLGKLILYLLEHPYDAEEKEIVSMFK